MPFMIYISNYSSTSLKSAKVRKRYEAKPNDFSAKWLGIINLNNNRVDTAKRFLLESLKFNNQDAQAWYNLAGCYVMQNNYKSALDAVNNSLKITPQYKEAKALQYQLMQAVKK